MGSTRTSRWSRVAIGTAATAGLLLGGSGVAAAASTTPEPGPITLSPEQSRRICEERIPALLDRIDRLETRLDGDADSPGSTAWLQSRVNEARDNGRDALASRLQRRLDRRPETAQKLAGAQRRVESFRAEQCG
jgi:hypothetical protein